MFKKLTAKRKFNKRYKKHTYHNRKYHLYDCELDTWIELDLVDEMFYDLAMHFIANDDRGVFANPEWFTVADEVEAVAHEEADAVSAEIESELTPNEPDFVVEPISRELYEPTPQVSAPEPVYSTPESTPSRSYGSDDSSSSYSSSDSSSSSSDTSSGGCD